MNRRQALLCIIALWSASSSAQRTDLTGLKFCIDPGHGGFSSDDRNVIPDPGVNFWESQSNFDKALLLRQLLWQQGATVILTRTSNDTTYPGGDDEPSLTARWQLANANNVDWFHSIHSNASGLAVNSSINYSLMLVKENIPTRTAAFPQAVTMSNLIGPAIQAKLRTSSTSTWLDYTFYGGPGVGFNLGVLSGLIMPGELSEGSFHDFFPECRRLLNNDYHKMEAYAIRNAFMQYFSVPADPRGIIAGIQTDVAGGNPVNFTRVRLLPPNRVYNGDSFRNGFYMFDSLAAGSYTVRFETPGYRTDSLQITVGSGATVFADRGLESTGLPVVLTSSPSNNDTAVIPTLPVRINFSTRMDTATVRAAFSISPSVTGSLAWDSNNTVLTFSPASHFPFLVSFTVKVDTNARSQAGRPLDGTGIGTPGNPFILHFRTRFIRVDPPKIVSRYPDSAMTVATPFHSVNITFDEPLNPASVLPSNFAFGKVGGGLLARTLRYYEGSGKGGVNMFPSAPLEPGGSYIVRVSGVTDMTGNTLPNTSAVTWTFSVGPSSRLTATIDSFDTAPVQWKQPMAARYTTGVDTASFSFVQVPVYPGIQIDPGAAALTFTWDTTASSWLLRVPLDTLASQKALQWQKVGTVLEAYVFADGGSSQFRFAVEDSVDVYPGGRAQNHKVSRWYPLNWVGWELLEWDLANDSVGVWLGSPALGGQMRFDGFQLRSIPGISARSGNVVIDQLQIAKAVIVSVTTPAAALPGRYALDQNFPNPFNPSTVIGYHLPADARVTLKVFDLLGREIATLVDGTVQAGSHAVTWNAGSLGSGVYFARLSASDPGGGMRYLKTTKLELLK
jgi:N-acetylmuramoyl-L-alanine amidase